jgi:o-succinylbenzoate---CoA ligase
MKGVWSAERAVRAHAAAAAGEPAILVGSSSVTWADLDARCDRVAGAVQAAGAAAGELVALVAEPSADAIAALLGTLRAGAIIAPLPSRLPTPELTTAIEVVGPSLVLHDRPDGLRDALSGRRALPIDEALMRARSIDPRHADRGAVDVDPEAAAIIVLTSGTTGLPKGVILSGRALAASAGSWLRALPPVTGWLLALGLGHVAGLGVLWRAVLDRVPLRIVQGNDAPAMLAALGQSPPLSHVSLVPAQLARLLDEAADRPPPPSLRAVLLGGGTIPPRLVDRAIAAGWPVVPTYGLSEAASGVTALPTAAASEAPGSAGWPLTGVSVRIDDPDGDGEGEIVVTGPMSFSGYVGEARRVPGDPIRTGDVGRLDAAGRLTVIDRRTDRIVRGGENISPSEIETVLLAHPAIADAAVVGRPDPLWGSVPVAAIVARPEAVRPSPAMLAAHCRRSLAGFKVPVAFAWLDSLPRTPGGKLRREAVRTVLGGTRAGQLTRPDGARIGWRSTGSGVRPVILLHGTLSTATQLDRLAAELARSGDVIVHAVDRRASGASRVENPAPIDVGVHVDDLVAVLDHLGIPGAVLVGLSYGGVLALEAAARRPDRVLAVAAWEPPYGPLADAATRARLGALAAATEEAHRDGGAAAAAETFLRAVAGDGAWERLPVRSRAFLAREGDGALADAALLGADPAGLASITAPTTVLTGDASDPFYAIIAEALMEWIPGARRARLEGLDHPAPITDPARVATAILDAIPPVPEPPRP